MSGIFTALYSKDDSIIVDLSLRYDPEKIEIIESFIKGKGNMRYERNDLVGISTILIHFEKEDQKKAQLFLDDLYEFID
jgi:hypothetical protein